MMTAVHNTTLTSSGDPDQLPLVGSPWPTLTILAAYLLIVLKVGRKFMENRKPYDLRGVIKGYNIFQIVYNGLLVLAGIYFLFVLRPYNLGCIQSLPKDHKYWNLERQLAWAYYFNKYTDLTETFFFLLRKKYSQISVLHVFHHTMMCLSGYFVLTYAGFGGLMFPLALLNVAVHVIMYTYYYLSSVSAAVRASLWWKKYITIVQLVQFLLGFTFLANTLRTPNCNASRLMICVGMLLTSSFTVLFANFYVRTYILPKQDTKKSTQKIQ